VNFTELATFLWKMGHAPQFKSFEEALGTWVSKGGIEEAIKRYQEYHNLPASGVVDETTQAHLAQPRCGRPDVQDDSATLCQWPMTRLTWFQQIVYPNVDPAVVEAHYAQAWRQWEEVCGITAAQVTDQTQARVVATAGKIDGPGNILAESELPCGAAATTQLSQTFDVADEGTLSPGDLMVACMCHEIGHALGLSHAVPGSGNLMEPIISSISAPQAGDIAEVVRRYGAPASSSVPAAAPPRVEPVTFDLDVPVAGKYQITVSFVPPS
jgi:hypothetical protein